jgi:histidyl-tRNA synthetase
VGFAAGIERILLASAKQTPQPSEPVKRHGIYVAIAQPSLMAEGFGMVSRLRERGVRAVTDYDQKSLKAQFREADKQGCRLIAVLGERELKQRAIAVKDLEQGGQETVPLDAFVEELAKRLQQLNGQPSPRS